VYGLAEGFVEALDEDKNLCPEFLQIGGGLAE
jgi:hypothetical protein